MFSVKISFTIFRSCFSFFKHFASHLGMDRDGQIHPVNITLVPVTELALVHFA